MVQAPKNVKDNRQISEDVKNAARTLGSMGGLERASRLSAEKRAEIGRLGAGVRWGKRREKQQQKGKEQEKL